ncbi:restriction endonuclease subunit S [Sphingomonas aracearum]|uniref:Restriction endonuclease subunit S n=1 Tax=Sphingomonas aracearum TaxID=2283317 RepID=A0A369W2W7_9SPHN|nr:restriction endonuclease subunit S [Sphingomonas aracearum]RDE06411.1 restriction endonuclease subunit S [Sphingomonas aracearum]
MDRVKPEWQERPLADLATIKSGFAFKSSQWKPAGVPVVKIGNVRDGSLDMTGCSYVSDRDAADSGFELQKNDLVIGLTGYVGQVAKVRNEGRLVLNQRVGKFQVRRGCDPDFLFALVANGSFRERVEAIAHGSAQPNVSPKAIEQLGVFAPSSLQEQRSIAAVLSALDDKIALNRRMNETLEASARALFRDWFVDFGPTRAKAEGRPAYLTPDLWSLFPDRLGDDGVPEGWDVRPLDQIAEFLNGLALQKYPAVPGEEDLPVIKIAELRSGISANSNRASPAVPAKYVVEDGDFLFSWSGSLLAKFWTGGRGALNQHLFKVTSHEYSAWFYTHWVWHHLEDFQMIAASKATTMGHIQRGHLSAATTVCPPPAPLATFGAIIEPLQRRMVDNLIESRTLAATRDALLPKLMSGELRVRDAEALAA